MSNCSQAPHAASSDIPCVDGYLYRYIDTLIRIQTEYMSFKNRSTISSCNDFQEHKQHFQKKCYFSQTALLWFEVLQHLSPALSGAFWLVVDLSMLATSVPSYSEGQQEWPTTVLYSPEIDTSKFTLHILWDTPGGFRWLKSILLMYVESDVKVSVCLFILPNTVSFKNSIFYVDEPWDC